MSSPKNAWPKNSWKAAAGRAGARLAHTRSKISGSIAANIAAGLKGFGGVTAGGDQGWTTIMGGSRGQRYAGSNIDWSQRVGDMLDNAALSICIGYIFNKVAEPRLQVVTDEEDGGVKPDPKHPMLAMLRRPNNEYTGREMLQALSLSYKTDGNGYLVKARGARGSGAVRELWYIPHWEMTPDDPGDGGPTKTYTRRVGGRVVKTYNKEDVIHFRKGLDPRKPRKGLSPTKALLRSLVSDGEVDTYTAVIFGNLGISLIVSPAEKDDEFDSDAADEMKEMMREGMRGDERGALMVPSRAVKVDRAGATPEEMALDKIGQRPESRICASMDIIPQAVGLSTGSDTAKYGAFMKEARESSYEGAIVPVLTVIADGLTEDFLEEGLLKEGERFAFDYKGVRDLQPDANALATRVKDLFQGGILKRSRSQELIGEKADTAGDGYFQELYPTARPSVPVKDGEGADE